MTEFVQHLIPSPHRVSVDTIVDAAKNTNQSGIKPADPAAIELCTRLSHLLLNDPRGRIYPELATLGFWMRPASLKAMLREFHTALPGTARVPAGIIFHIPPSNVDTLFIYPAIIALLCGNVSIVRLSSTIRPLQDLLILFLHEALTGLPNYLRQHLIILRYGHDDIITTKLSAACHRRLVWGGDETIRHIRKIPLPVLASEIGFGDRFSTSVLNASRYNLADQSARNDLIHQFYNDMYWFDQMACASPRLLVWVGAPAACDVAEKDFSQLLSMHTLDRGYAMDTGAGVARNTFTYLALHDLDVAGYMLHNPNLITLQLAGLKSFSAFKAINYGYGLLMMAHIAALDDLADLSEPRDQTLTHWGFEAPAISTLSEKIMGRGYNRMVPVGSALAFDAIWDGYSLFEVMSRLVRIKT